MKIIVSDTSVDGAKQDEVIFKVDTKDNSLYFKDDKDILETVKESLQDSISIIDKWNKND